MLMKGGFFITQHYITNMTKISIKIANAYWTWRNDVHHLLLGQMEYSSRYYIHSSPVFLTKAETTHSWNSILQ